ncbi:ribosomal protein S18-alanine N-acetyltransferase [Mycobacterium paragordonae]|uniref:Ribosomal protein S18-alanine N-acetyltransferase n=1 Tax=Mycobacterium paragordonae TaxID=1389713 RepID=A0AAJ1RXB9_9MYCO|nr:ribosomal protein S18-alanine N-acetyltransferase [Mycobacterium paragordonae]MDP7733440.1 ribosomal protein S18-alanine N-acetyltransferase [Mycobacterium paragordonae]
MTDPQEPVVFGALLPSDVGRCAELDAVLFAGDEPWSAAVFERELANTDGYFVSARTAGALIGYGGIARLGSTGFSGVSFYEVRHIAVDPAHQGQGIGRRLLDELLKFAAGGAVFLEVRCDNEAAIALYRDFGFDQVGVRPGYYNGADALTMRREPRASTQLST